MTVLLILTFIDILSIKFEIAMKGLLGND